MANGEEEGALLFPPAADGFSVSGSVLVSPLVEPSVTGEGLVVPSLVGGVSVSVSPSAPSSVVPAAAEADAEAEAELEGVPLGVVSLGVVDAPSEEPQPDLATISAGQATTS